MNKKQKLAVIDAILKLNAALIDQPQKVFVTTAPKGWIRVGTHREHGLASRSYPSIDAALGAAWEALERAKAAAK